MHQPIDPLEEALQTRDFRALYKELGFNGCLILLAQAAQQIKLFVKVIKEEYLREQKEME